MCSQLVPSGPLIQLCWYLILAVLSAYCNMTFDATGPNTYSFCLDRMVHVYYEFVVRASSCLKLSIGRQEAHTAIV